MENWKYRGIWRTDKLKWTVQWVDFTRVCGRTITPGRFFLSSYMKILGTDGSNIYFNDSINAASVTSIGMTSLQISSFLKLSKRRVSKQYCSKFCCLGLIPLPKWNITASQRFPFWPTATISEQHQKKYIQITLKRFLFPSTEDNPGYQRIKSSENQL